jgi:hypothetical protein
MRCPQRLAIVALVAFVAGLAATGDDPRRTRVVFSIDLEHPHASGLAGEATVHRIAYVLRRELGVPVPTRFAIHLYDSTERFAEGLVLDADVAPDLAAQLAQFATGVAVPRAFLLRAAATELTQGAEAVRLVAHELTHLGQIALAGEGRAAHWLAEGMAEWTAHAVLERLGLGSIAAFRSAVLPDVRARLVADRQLDLAGMSTPGDFLATHRSRGTVATYHVAFALADYLVRRDGFPALLGYFGAFRGSPDAAANFRRAFGQDVATFEREVRDHLTTI